MISLWHLFRTKKAFVTCYTVNKKKYLTTQVTRNWTNSGSGMKFQDCSNLLIFLSFCKVYNLWPFCRKRSLRLEKDPNSSQTKLCWQSFKRPRAVENLDISHECNDRTIFSHSQQKFLQNQVPAMPHNNDLLLLLLLLFG